MPGNPPMYDSNVPTTRRGTCTSAPIAWSGWWDSNPRPRPSEGRRLPLTYTLKSSTVRSPRRGYHPSHLLTSVTLFRHKAQQLARPPQHPGGSLPACAVALIAVRQRTVFPPNKELSDRSTDDVTFPRASDLTSSRCQCLSPSQGWAFSHVTVGRSMVSVRGFEPPTSCTPSTRSKPG